MCTKERLSFFPPHYLPINGFAPETHRRVDFGADQLLTQDQVLTLIQVSKKTFRTMLETGEFPSPILVSKSKRWSMDTVRRWRIRLELQQELEKAGGAKRGILGNFGESDEQDQNAASQSRKPR